MRDSKFKPLRIGKTFKWSLVWLMILMLVVQSLALAPSSALGASADFAGGEGTKENPYLIATADQFDKIRHERNKHYRLTADINLAGYSNWEPIPEFSGSLDGADHTISNLTIERDTMNDVGLFSTARMDDSQGNSISNLKMENVKVIGLAGVGSLVGRVYSGIISNVAVDQVEIHGKGEAVGGLIGRIDSNTAITDSSATNVTVDGAHSHVGGLTGRNAAAAGTSATVSNSFASGTVKGMGNHIGGLMGSLNNGTVTDSYSTVQVEGNNNNTGGLIGIIDAGQVIDSYATGNVKGEAFTGGLIGSLVNGAIINSYATGITEGTEHTIGGLVGQMNHENSLIENSQAEGDVFGNHSHIGGLVGVVNLGNIHYGIAEGHVINTGTGENTGGLIGWMKGGSTVSHSVASGDVTKTGSRGGNIGGLIGWVDNGTIISSSASGKVTSNITVRDAWNTGGLIGRLRNGTVENSSASGEVTGNLGENTGGLIGNVDSGQVLNASAIGNVSSNGSNSGGLIGLIGTAQVRNSSATGDVSNGDSNAGGLIGLVLKQAIVSDSFARGNVSTFGIVDVDSSNVGGLIGGVGRNAGLGEEVDEVQLIRVQAYGNVSAKQGYTGGLVGLLHGQANALIEDSSAYGNVTVEGTRTSEKAGGLVGEMLGGSILSSRASGDVQGVMAGGMVGNITTRYPVHIRDVYYSGTVLGKEDTGGIVGRATASNADIILSNAFSSGQVLKGKILGGIIGYVHTRDGRNILIQDVYALQSKIGDQDTPTSTVHRVIGEIWHWSVYNEEVTLQNLRVDPAMAIEEKRKLGLDNWGGQDVDAEVNQAIGWKDTARIRTAYRVVLAIPIEEPIRQVLLDRLAEITFFEVKMPDATTEPLLIGNQFGLPIQYRTVGSLNGTLRITMGSQNMVLPITDPLPDTSGEWQDFTVNWDSEVSPIADGSYTSVQIKFVTTERSWDYEWNQAVIKDTVPPNITVDAKLADDTAYVAETIANQSVTVTSSAVDEQTDVALHQYQINEGEWQDYVDPVVLDSDGDYSIVFKAQDRAGNEQLSSEIIISLQLNNAEPPTITTQPSDITVTVDGDAILSVEANVSDGGELSYQWYSNTSNSTSGGVVIADATSATYKAPTTTAGTTYYYVEVTNSNTAVTGSQTATITSSVAPVMVIELTFAELPEITTHPLDITINEGSRATLSVVASVSDGGDLSYQWYSNTSNSTRGGNWISGATSATYEAPTSVAGTTYYYVVVTNTKSDPTGIQTAVITSEVAAVTVIELTHAEFPTITTHPLDITVNIGDNAALSVAANVSDGGELSYQWYSNTSNSTSGGVAIADATSATYEAPTTTAGTAYYYVVVTNTNTSTEVTGSQTATVTSQVAAVTVNELTDAEPPTITMQPSDITVDVGGNANLSVTANVSDGGELSYQWYSNTSDSTSGGTAIIGATSVTYAAPTTSVGTTYYYVEVTNENTEATGSQTATTTSQVAAVAVNELTNAEPPTITIQPLDITVTVDGDAILSVVANVSDGGELSYQWYSNTSNSTSGGTAIIGAINVTYEAPTTSVGTTYYYVEVTNENTEATGSQTATITSQVAAVTVNELTNAEPPTITTQPSDITVNVGGNANLSVTANVSDGGELSYQWYSNTSDSTSGGTAIIGAINVTYEAPTTSVGTTYYYVEVTNENTEATGSKTAMTTSQVAAVTVNELTNAELPAITTQPLDITVNVGDNAVLNVAANVSDGGELSYQWYSNTSNSTSGGVVIDGATNATYKAPTTSVGTTYYYVEVTNENTEATGSKTAMTTSQVAAVTVNELTNAELPTITTQPLDITVNVGGNAVLIVAANVSDGGELGYQWYSNTSNSISGGVVIDGATSATYEAPTTSVGTIYYYVEVTNTNAEATGNQTAKTTSRAAAVTANELIHAEPPTITTQPLDITVNVGSNANLSVVANVSDGGELGYQWYSNTSNSTSGGVVIDGATNATYKAPTTSVGTTYYYVEVTNTNAEATGNQTAKTTSRAAAVTANELIHAEPPTITTQPLDITVNVGSNANLSVVANVSDGGELGYQWYSNTSNSTSGGVVIDGATSATYEAPTTSVGTTYYYVEVTNTNAEATGNQTATTTSQVVAVTVNELSTNAATPTATPGGGTVSSGTVVALSTSTDDATIYYTTDGSTPSINSSEYTAPIEVTAEITIKAIAMKEGMNDSEVMIEHYTIATVPIPANLTATAGDGLVTLNWDEVIGTDTVTYAVYQYEGATAPTNQDDWVLVQENVTADTYVVSDLTNGTSYAFVIKAFVAEIASDFSNAATATPQASNGGEGSNGGGGSWIGGDPDHVISTNGSIIIPVGSSGEVSLAEEILIKVPKGAADRELYITIEKMLDPNSRLTDEGVLISQLADEGTRISQLFEVTKNIKDKLKKPASVSIKFDPAKVGSNENISIFYYDEEKKSWSEIGGTVNGERITAEADDFNKFAVLAMDVSTDDGEESPNEPVPSFSDISGHWAERSIKRAAAQHLVSGYPKGTFKPNAPITRTEFTVMLANALQLDKIGGGLSFEDRDEIDKGLGFKDQDEIGAWAERAIALAMHAGIVNGYEDGSFRPNARITRAEMATMIARALELSLETVAATSFVDDQDIPKWAKGAVEAMHKLGVIGGRTGNQFVPNDEGTRAEATVMLLRMLE